MTGGTDTLAGTRIKTAIPAGIPDELKTLAIWIVWRREIDPDTKKERKLPYQSKFPARPAKSNDERTWSTFEQAVFTLQNENVDGLGIATVSPFIVLDFDDCIDESLDGDVQDTVDRINTFGEISQSGTGLHLIGKGTIDRDILKRLSKFFEIADEKKFLYLTGDHLTGTSEEIRDITEPLKGLWYEKFKVRFLERYGEIRKVIPPNLQKSEKTGTICEDFNLHVHDVGMPDDPVTRGPGIFQGGHPFHGSETGFNFSVDTGADVWYCFRHRVGGGPLELFAVKQGIIACEQVGPGCLDGKWSEVFDLLERCGYHRKNTADQMGVCDTPVKSWSVWSVEKTGSENSDIIAPNGEQSPDTPIISLTRKPWSVTGQSWSVNEKWVVSDQDHVTIFTKGQLLKAGSEMKTGDQRMPAVILTMCFTWLKAKTNRDTQAIDKATEFNAKRCDPPLTTDEMRALVNQTFSALKTVIEEKDKEEPDTGIDKRINKWAVNILKRGAPFKFFKNTFQTLHSGDVDVIDTMFCAYAVQAALCTMGIQISLDGRKGAGKTSAVKAALHLHAPEYVLEGSFSGKALFYDQRLRDGCIIFSDDTILPPDMASLVKRAMTNFQQGTFHLTVEKDKEGKNTADLKTIPKRTIIIFTSVGDTGDDEILDRQYRLSVAPTPDANKKFIEFVKGRMVSGREEYPVTRQVLVCREITRILKSSQFVVEIPFAKDIEFFESGARRDILLFFDFIMGCAVIHFMQRNTKTDDTGIITVTADRKDATRASQIFKAGQETRKYRLGKDQRAILDWMIKNADKDSSSDISRMVIEEEYIIKQYGSDYNISRSGIRRLLYGNDMKSGLVNKVPGISVQKVSVKYDTRFTQKNMIYIDPDLKSTIFTYTEFAEITDQTDRD